MPFRRKDRSHKLVTPADEPLIPIEAAVEALKRPGKWVYAIDSAYDPNGEVPARAIKGYWKVDDHGSITGDFVSNPNYVSGWTGLDSKA
ncbi:MAG: hypothetical protein JWP75_1932 [Frondihabitans sp.]|nr:hypothetical protein [Frondihabitans sp.]